jgi:hypothetical protein
MAAIVAGSRFFSDAAKFSFSRSGLTDFGMGDG